MKSITCIIETTIFGDILFSQIKPSDWVPFVMILTIAGIIAYFLGRYRHIGFLWSWFFLAFLYVFGIPIILSSGNYFDEASLKRSRKTEMIGWVFAILFGISAIYNLIFRSLLYTFPFIGLCGLGIYLVHRGKGRIPNEPSMNEIATRNIAIRKQIAYNIEQNKIIKEQNKTLEKFLGLFKFNSKIDTMKNTEGASKKAGLTILNSWVYSKERKIQNIRYLGISIFAGFILGWYYKLPNSKFLMGLTQADSLWRKNLVVELQKKESSFFSTDLFSFNWLAFFCTTFICFLLLLFFTDEKFRQYLYDKITFSKEKEAQ